MEGKVKDQIYKFAVEGLRTLVMGERYLEDEEANDILQSIEDAKGKEPKKKERSREDQMKDLINQAEKYASFLLSKHKMNSQG